MQPGCKIFQQIAIPPDSISMLNQQVVWLYSFIIFHNSFISHLYKHRIDVFTNQKSWFGIGLCCESSYQTCYNIWKINGREAQSMDYNHITENKVNTPKQEKPVDHTNQGKLN